MNKLPSALAAAGITPEQINKWKASGFGKSAAVRPEDKQGAAAAQLDNIITLWIEVTPEMAVRWLKANFINRSLKEDVVTSYMRQIMSGDFIPTHQGIAFNDADELIDGQHFLTAVVRSGITVRRMVTFGLPKNIPGKSYTVMDVVDSGKSRSVADQLKIQHGLKNGNAIAQICSTIAHLCVGERMRRLSVGQTLDIYREFKAGVDFVIEQRSKAAGLKSAGVLGAFAFVSSTQDNQAGVGKFFETLNSGEDIGRYAALKLMREFLTGENASLILASMNRGIAELTVWTLWNELQHFQPEKLATEPVEWLKAVEHFRGAQPARVDKIARMFKLPALEAALKPLIKQAEPMPDRIPVQVAAPAASQKDRPTLALISGKVENYFKLSWFIISGRGRDTEIDAARVVFITLARSFGHTASIVAATLKRTEEQIRDLTLPVAALSTKQKKAFETIKAKL